MRQPRGDEVPNESHRIGRQLAALRQQHRLTQEALAELSGTHINTVKKVERGDNASLPTYHVLATALSARVDVVPNTVASGATGASFEEPSLPPVVADDEFLSVCAADSARYGQQIDTPLGEYTLDELGAELTAIATEYPAAAIMPLLRRAHAVRERVWFLQNICQRPGQLRDLHWISGWSSALIANASFDMGAIPAARTHARVATLQAELIGEYAPDLTHPRRAPSTRSIMPAWTTPPQKGHSPALQAPVAPC